MLSAELNISRQEFDWGMEIAQIGSCIRYRNENPPAGKVIIEIVNAFFGDKEATPSQNNTVDTSKEKVIDVSKKQYNNSAEDFFKLFGMAGGTVQ